MNRPLTIVVMTLLGTAAGFLLLSMVSYSANQIIGASPSGSNLMGLGGAWAAHSLISFWGIAAFVVPLMMLGYAVGLWREYDLANLGRRLTGSLLLIPALCGMTHLLPASRLGEALLIQWDQTQLRGLGGSLGYLLCGPVSRAGDHPSYAGGLLLRSLETPGAVMALLALFALSLLLMDLGLIGWLRRLWNYIRIASQRRSIDVVEPDRFLSEPFVPQSPAPRAKNRATTSFHEITRRIADEQALPPDAHELVEKIRSHRRALERGTADSANADAEAAVEPPIDEEVEPTSEPTPAVVPSVPAISLDAVTPTPSPKPKPKKPKRSATADGEYELPPVDLLDAKPMRKEAEHEAEKNHTARAIEEVFSHFNISVQVVTATRGPVVTQYEIRLMDQAMRVSKVEGFEKDLAMKLGTEGIRIVAPLPNKTTIGVEVPNRVKEQVVMRDLVEEFDPDQMALPVILGRDVVGNPIISDLAKMPHLLVAGATGMGKSVCMNALICSILLFKGPEHVRFIMVDPKMVELAGYEDIPHLLTPPITDMTKAHASLEWACRTMDQRYEALRQVGVRDIKSYNELGESEIRLRLGKKDLRLEDLESGVAHMPYIVVLVDEYADLMMVNKEVEKSIVRLAAKSRACGIHVILTTQRPSADVVTGLIKSNLPSRICFRVVDKSNSRVVLDVSGAENLLGRGDMLFLQPGTSQPIRGQGVWLKDSEISAIVSHAKQQGSPEYDEDVVNVGAVAMLGGAAGGGGAGIRGGEWLSDRQFHESVQAMYRYNRSGADFFRRKCNIGYNKATAYVEQLEDLGFLGPQKGTAPRDILKTWDDWIELLKANGLTWTEEDDLYHNPVELRS
ncbi:MAG: DNA translocase FtsK 4TM domain-containing protein [Planctomycetes bacterium]|nr:DNA translocase FtsK 4TM domain-containing protein [Planctomycetota bacterium]